jgi:hypothetical protein
LSIITAPDNATAAALPLGYQQIHLRLQDHYLSLMQYLHNFWSLHLVPMLDLKLNVSLNDPKSTFAAAAKTTGNFAKRQQRICNLAIVTYQRSLLSLR